MVLTRNKKIGAGVAVAAAIAAIIALTKKAVAAPKIKLSNLTINPSPCNPSQNVTISVTAMNDSTAILSKEIYLGGDFMAQQSVTLNPNQSQIVAFTITPTVAGNYHVSVDGLSGSFICTEVPVANIQLSALVITPATCYVGDTVEISVEATNVGTAAGSRTITCTVT